MSRCASCRARTDLFVCLLCLVLLSLDLVLLHLACVFLLLVEEVLDDVGLVEEESVGGDDGDLGGLARQVAAVERLRRRDDATRQSTRGSAMRASKRVEQVERARE